MVYALLEDEAIQCNAIRRKILYLLRKVFLEEGVDDELRVRQSSLRFGSGLSMPPSQAVMKAALQAYVDRTNAGDAEGLAALFAEHAVIEDPIGTPAKSKAEFVALMTDGVALGSRITPVAPIRGSHGAEAALVFDVEYTPPGGPRTRIRSLEACTFGEDGLITSLRAYWGPDDIEETGA